MVSAIFEYLTHGGDLLPLLLAAFPLDFTLSWFCQEKAQGEIEAKEELADHTSLQHQLVEIGEETFYLREIRVCYLHTYGLGEVQYLGIDCVTSRQERALVELEVQLIHQIADVPHAIAILGVCLLGKLLVIAVEVALAIANLMAFGNYCICNLLLVIKNPLLDRLDNLLTLELEPEVLD